jgi:hypothetical protein
MLCKGTVYTYICTPNDETATSHVIKIRYYDETPEEFVRCDESELDFGHTGNGISKDLAA